MAREDCYAHPQDKQRVNLDTALSVADIPSPTGTKDSEPARRYAEFIFYIGLSRGSSDLSLMITPKIFVFDHVPRQIPSFSEYGPWCQWPNACGGRW
jgi:hypothetical protein